jgi:hypothetical protein
MFLAIAMYFERYAKRNKVKYQYVMHIRSDSLPQNQRLHAPKCLFAQEVGECQDDSVIVIVEDA